MLTIILHLQEDNAESIKSSINSLKSQTIGFDKLHVIILDSVKNKSEGLITLLNILIKEKNITITTEIDIENVIGDYISFLNTNYVINQKCFENLYNHIQSKDIDFVSAVEKNFTKITIKDGNALSSNYYALTGLKLIKKEILLSQSFNKMRGTKNINIQYIHLKLFLQGFKYSVAKECVYRHHISFDEKYINQSIFEVDSMIGLLNEDSMRLKEEGNFLLICHIMFMIDKNTFLDNIEEQSQRNLYNNLGLMLDKVDYNKFSKYNLEGYTPFFNLILKGLYEEATQFMRLLRSKRYWFNEADRLEKYFIKNPNDLNNSLSWKVTEPLRKCNTLLYKGYNLFYKYLIILLAVIVRISYPNKQIWLVGEREDQAEDNGYYFFKYCREKYPNEKIYYIINKSSPQLDKVNILGNVIYHSSYKHRIFMLAAHVYINAWVFEECSYPKPKKAFIDLFKGEISKKVNISIQHGVIIQNISPYLS
ncbi:CDP-glycerol glycerophosphotransferase family protein, partial [Neobacillus drentensis]|uniref:CDP-glycerol glycerophosphotransferase family protein n=1 Tax=Neobacillus drentensis TaxID=220684 RepID=UPI002FFED5AD